MQGRKSSNVISLRKRKFEKKYGKFTSKKKYLLIFIGIPILITSILMIDREFRQSKQYYQKEEKFKNHIQEHILYSKNV